MFSHVYAANMTTNSMLGCIQLQSGVYKHHFTFCFFGF